jgi:hypothetical protein
MRTPVVHREGTTPPAGDWRSIAPWLAVLALACGRADDAQSSPVPTDVGSSDAGEPGASGPNESSAGDDDSNDAGASFPSGDSSGCPAPGPEQTRGEPAAWARVPATGECCRYANRTSAPFGWRRFDDEAACKRDCLCEGSEDPLTMRDSLECRCSLESCPSTLEEAEQTLCAVTTPEAAVQRLVGCGMVAVADRNGYSGYAWVFERPSASGDAGPPASRLVGASKFSDAVSFDACETSTWEAGRDFFAECDAAAVVACQLCGDSPGSDAPPCQ